MPKAFPYAFFGGVSSIIGCPCLLTSVKNPPFFLSHITSLKKRNPWCASVLKYLTSGYHCDAFELDQTCRAWVTIILSWLGAGLKSNVKLLKNPPYTVSSD